VNEKAFRLDFFIAIAALLVSAISAIALLYQTRVVADQYAATIWPYLTVETTYSPRGEEVAIVNDGLGPALVGSAQLSVDGTTLPDWKAYFALLMRDSTVRTFMEGIRSEVLAGKTPNGTISTSSLDPGNIVRPGERVPLVKIDLPDAPTSALVKHPLAIDLCYCSLNDSCWMLHATQGASFRKPQPVTHCTADASIEAPNAMSPSALPRKRSP
jgi:hypothetical protein